jgi:chaperonin cofactor prefoldin
MIDTAEKYRLQSRINSCARVLEALQEIHEEIHKAFELQAKTTRYNMREYKAALAELEECEDHDHD